MTVTAAAKLDSIIKAMTPDEDARRLAASHRESLESWLRRDIGIYRMRETGSWHHGTAIRFHSDVDYFVTMPGPRPTSSMEALELLRVSLSRGISNVSVRIDRPAVRVTYFDDGPAVEITPAYFVGDDDYEIPDPDGIGWINSNPAVHLDYVSEAQKNTDGKVKSLVRLVKTWKARNSVPLSSFYLEMRVAKYAVNEKHIVFDWDLRDFFKGLSSNGLREMNDPTNYGRRIATGANGLAEALSAKYAVDEAARLAALARECAESDDNCRAVNYWSQFFKLHEWNY